jgi:hypothetical protein
VCELVSLALIGPGAAFPYGLVLGLAVAIIGMRLLAATVEALTGRTRGKKIVTLGYLVRILLYALALYLCVRTGLHALFGCMAGLLLPKAALPFGQLAMPKIRKALGKEEPVTEHFVAVPDPRSRLFVKSQAMVKYQGGRAFLTYRHFKHYKMVYGQADKYTESARPT